MKRFFIFLMAGITLISFSERQVSADMATDLNTMLGNYQSMSNYTVPGAYQGQTQGYATGGSLAVRIPTTNLGPLVSVTPPSIKGGCGGIDINMGGISYLQPQQIVQKVQAVLANSAGTLFFLALQTLSPEISTINGYMEKASSFMNGLNMNSCQAAQKLVGLGIDTMVTDTTQKCALQRLTNGQSTTMEDAKLACNQSPTNTGTNPTPGSELDPTSNFTYMSIVKYSYGSDPILTRQLLSLIGGVIFEPNPAGPGSDPPYVPKTFGPQITVFDLMTGGSKPLYSCPNTAGTTPYTCTDMFLDPNAVTMSDMTTVVNTVLASIYNKLSSPYGGPASDLSAGELAFIGNNALPIYQTLNILSTNPTLGAAELPVISQMLTGYFTKIYLERVLNDIQAGLDSLQVSHNGLQLKVAKEYFSNRKGEIEKELSKLNDNSPQNIFYATQYLETYTKAMMQRMPKEIISNLNFAKKVGGG